MATRKPSLHAGRDLVLVGGALVLMLGLASATSRMLYAEPIPAPAATIAADADMDILPGAARPVGDGARLKRAPVSCPPLTPGARGDAAMPAPSGEDLRDYPGKMAAMLHRRRVPSPMAVDPYQVSLNPAVYLAGAETPSGDNRVSAGVSHKETSPMHSPPRASRSSACR